MSRWETADDYSIGRRPRPEGPPLPLEEFARRLEAMAGGAPDDRRLRLALQLATLRTWKRYAGGIAGGKRCSCGDVADACGGARGRCRRFGAPPGTPPVPPPI